MSQKNSQEAKAKRRLRNADRNIPKRGSYLYVRGVDKYGNVKYNKLKRPKA